MKSGQCEIEGFQRIAFVSVWAEYRTRPVAAVFNTAFLPHRSLTESTTSQPVLDQSSLELEFQNPKRQQVRGDFLRHVHRRRFIDLGAAATEAAAVAKKEAKKWSVRVKERENILTYFRDCGKD